METCIFVPSHGTAPQTILSTCLIILHGICLAAVEHTLDKCPLRSLKYGYYDDRSVLLKMR
jgi:hypothetical protein